MVKESEEESQIFRDRSDAQPQGNLAKQLLEPSSYREKRYRSRRRRWREQGGGDGGGSGGGGCYRVEAGARERVGKRGRGKDLEGGRGRESESKESKELFQASLPRPARLNFFSAQEFSYYSKFSSRAARGGRVRALAVVAATVYMHIMYDRAGFYMRMYVDTTRWLLLSGSLRAARAGPDYVN